MCAGELFETGMGQLDIAALVQHAAREFQQPETRGILLGGRIEDDKPLVREGPQQVEAG